MARKVTIDTAEVGQAFGVCAVIRDAKTGRKLAVGPTKPYGFDAAAMAAGQTLASERGWTVVEVAS